MALILAVMLLAPTSSNAKNPCKGKPSERPPECNSGDDPPPTVVECVRADGKDESNQPCIASVGKWHPPPAKEYALGFPGGTYTEISSSEFGDILKTPQAPEDLCGAYDVLIFEWSSPKIKNFNWQLLLDYMACGGGIIFEDPINVVPLDPSVSTAEIHLHSKEKPRTIAFDAGCVVDPAAAVLCDTHPDLAVANPFAPFDIENNHIVFNLSEGLSPFLILHEDGPQPAEVLGLYGQFFEATSTFGAGRIVFTGPDNNFHGNPDPHPSDPIPQAHQNQYELLFREIDWVLVPPLPATP